MMRFRKCLRIVKRIMDEYADFYEYGEDLFELQQMKNMNICLDFEDEASCDSEANCGLYRRNATDNSVRQTHSRCLLLVPKNNLVTGKPNRVIYYGRLTDEILRFKHLREYFFKSEMMVLDGVRMELNDDEVVLYKRMVFGNYFDGIHLLEKNEFIQSRVMYNTRKNPLISFESLL